MVSKAQILDRVWSYDFGGDGRIVESYVYYLRRKIDKWDPPLIHTVRGVGYALRLPRGDEADAEPLRLRPWRAVDAAHPAWSLAIAALAAVGAARRRTSAGVLLLRSYLIERVDEQLQRRTLPPRRSARRPLSRRLRRAGGGFRPRPGRSRR